MPVDLSVMDRPCGLEKDLVNWFCDAMGTEHREDRIPATGLDTVVREMAFRFGRADIVVFHVDGSASVIEAKDGTKGYKHVVGGIGQVALYAAQLGMSRGALTKVRRCLMWTSTGDVFLDALIEEACEQSGVIALPYGSMKQHMADYKAVLSRYM